MTATTYTGQAPAHAPGRPPAPVTRTLPRAHPNAVLAAIAAGGVAVLSLWFHNTPSVHGLGDWLTNAGRILGLLAGYGVVVLIALMARLPPLERGVGADRLARWHSHGGRYVVSIVTAHALLITWGYAVTAHTNVVSQTGTLLTSYPDVLMATAGGLLLLGVGLTSMRAARKRLRYETWYYLHFYTYLAVALSFSHQFADGAEFISDRAARAVWAAMYVAVAVAIVWWRVAVPVRQALRHDLRVHAVVPEARGIVSVVISGRHLEELRAESGQFFRWRFLTRDLWWTALPISLSAPPRPDFLRITVKVVGDHTAAIAKLRPGTRVASEGPYGALVAPRRRTGKVLLVAAGVGITPLRALFQTLPAAPGDLTLVYRVGDTRQVAFREELETLAATRGARLHIVAGHRRKLGYDPLLAPALAANVPGLDQHEVYVCGPADMTTALVDGLRRAGVKRSRIHHEAFEL